jgi:CDP-L-myo-inositol myo-inositolphosphotransferase
MQTSPQSDAERRAQTGALVGPLPRLGVVLAAGRSERLQSVTGGGSKALVRLGGVPLVERAVRGLLAAGADQVVVVVGYQAGPVAAVVKRIAPGRVRAVHARDWTTGNGASLAAAERFVLPQDDLFVLVTMDHVFSANALEPVVRAGRPAVLVDRSPKRDVWEEGTRVRIKRGTVVAFSKDLDAPFVDCGAFLVPREIFDCLRRASQDGDYSLSGALTVLAESRPLRAVPLLAGSWWQDVDTKSDLRAAKRLLRRSLIKANDGRISRYLNRPVSTRISIVLAPLGVQPDTLSVVSAVAGVIGAWLVARGAGLVGALTVHASSVLDGVDGEVARLRLRERPAGAVLDGVLDRLVDAAIVVGLAIWALRDGASPSHVAVLAVAATAGAMLSMASKDRIVAVGLVPPPEVALGWLLGGRDGRLFLVVVFVLAGRPVFALVATAAASMLTLVVRVTWVLMRER